MTETRPRNDAVAKRAGDVARRGAGGTLAKPAAVYDTVTEGLTGRQFLLTGRWIAFMGAALAFAIICSILAVWQIDRGREASEFNATVTTNFNATPVPVSQALPNLTSYHGDQNWKRVSASGTYQDDQLFVRNRFRGSDVGFEVLTPLRMNDGRTLIVDRGWIASSSSDTTVPAHKPAPPSGSVNLVVRLRASEAPRGAGGGAPDQIQSVDLARVTSRIGGGAVYTGAYGVLNTQSPAASDALKPVQPTPPAQGVGYHYSYTVQWFLFALIGFFVLGRAIRNEFRRLNSDDPEERARAGERLKKQAKKPFTDEESEDELLNGYVPLSRWGFGPGSVLPPASGPAPRALGGVQRELDENLADADVFVLDSQADESEQDEPREDDSAASPADAAGSAHDREPS